ncbi:NAD(P)/FAD-dependent oxidoreductase [Pedobacter frigidisoli]|uniref:NAD(P)/FAD-dependent oxidoreductase n=1 Tax=Pedobacter frigidisoli TaxID=2530455 RepID=A0A4R0P3I5_9SPHI|nr:NAD(P)/FAD-dependent oxidoreductase [Pedobacter frigidisoli]TCD10203.1 NAD(P)/FAD-dependent oxidoreductase [Pedobacter frigidisoli]
MSPEIEILIIGGGLAGLTAAIHLQQVGLQVTLIEKQAYPHHKVCGEYISNEVLPYLNWLGIFPENLLPTHITDLQFTSSSGNSITTKLPLGGFGLSRYALDHHLYQIALERGVNILIDAVINTTYCDNHFLIETAGGKIFKANQVIGAYGKRGLMDVKFERNFISKKSPYLAVKAHYRSDFSNNLVSLHNFKGGYCGVSKIENKQLNICYLANYETFKKHKNIAAYQENVLYNNKYLKHVFEQSEMVFDAPLTISQISFEEKEPVFNHILMIGDTAGLIHPLCGNGMAMAIHSAKIVSALLNQHLKGKISTRLQLEQSYRASWYKLFGMRLRMGRILASVLRNDKLESFAMNAITRMPFLLNNIIKQTHGKPIIPQD